MSEENTWAADWVAALNEMPNIDRDRTVDTGQYSYKYATLANVIESVRKVLDTNGWAFVQEVASRDGAVTVTTRFYHRSGYELVFGPLAMPAGGNAQAIGSAITYARRYALTAALGLATEDDDDARSAVDVEQPAAPRPSEWLAMRVAMFSKWSEEDRREQYKDAMEALGIERFQTQEHAERIFEWMQEGYYTEHPQTGDEAPF